MFIISVALSLVISGLGFRWAKNTMSRRLRYVDAAQSRFAPIIAGVVAMVVVLPFTSLPVIGAVVGLGTVLAAGFGVGLGVASARREIRLATYRLDS
jgi:hypothetical protein